MDILALKAFKAVMDLGSVTAAADALNTVQPNISTRIRKLEDELGTTLFLRANRKVTPTEEAMRLLDYANRILTLEQAAREDVSTTACGSIKLGCTDSQVASLLPTFIKGYSRQFPDADIRVDSGVTEYLVDEVENGRLDAAVVVDVPNDVRLVHQPLFPDHLAFVAPASVNHFETALKMPLMVLKQEGCGYRNYALDWYREQGIAPPKLMEISTLVGIAECVKSGLCAAFLPQSILPPLGLDRGISVFPLTGKSAHIDLILVYRPELARDRRIAALHQTLLSCAPLHRLDGDVVSGGIRVD
ncbi:LysR family transcriptional regulator [Aestuariispira ectoiniformans]|uniref:LysR family transcriptional regulator n=1 Tax=Aestuariispira ectoiniformans TaxID=2775080 RepID=UPI00223AD797|nr:LysR family transcriptional regulator [Aestuariispira ectoiniformans]